MLAAQNALAYTILAVLASMSSGFIYFLGPTDVANHFMCAVNASMSPRALQRIAANIEGIADLTKNYTGEAATLRGLLPNEIVEKMTQCESLHKSCFRDTSSEDAGSGSSESLPTHFNSANSDDNTERKSECDPDYFIPLVVRCYKEADLMYFQRLAFNDEADASVKFFRLCLEMRTFGDDESDDDSDDK
ncbi:hypothetical protein BIW11_08142 [Tropilaelaps mercedesae]|uniref:Uncharacterized protein n=1 Tax=Tropilaelaps mercedesae TaxID=418985 RepID=A0A1V9XQV5_9ACAR|nr:hypothetical protein BIW11_08142 [Tropilaelaps mercedesae]